MLARFLSSFARAPAGTPRAFAEQVFFDDLIRRYVECAASSHDDNFDADRFGVAISDSQRAREAAFCQAALRTLLESPEKIQAACDLMADAESVAWLLDLMVYRLLGYRHVRLQSNRPRHWAERARAKSAGVDGAAMTGGQGNAKRFNLRGQDDGGILFDGWWSNVAWSFYLRQYYFSRAGVVIAPAPGDVVIDAGACFGDTALAFADSVGDSGKVHAFEVLPNNLLVAQHNLGLNPRLGARVALSDSALGAHAGTLFLHGSGPGALVSGEPSAQEVRVTTIDQYVRDAKMDRLDFIKMDIEGSEAAALDGARESLVRFRPKLAISVYHRPEDLTQIPVWVDNLGLGYRLYLDHYTIHQEETVLYAIAASHQVRLTV